MSESYPLPPLKIRKDMRLPSSKAAAQQRSINLAISSRGIAALQAIDPGATDRFLRAAIPMRGRMIHDREGTPSSQPYDRSGQVGVVLWSCFLPCINTRISPFSRLRPPSRGDIY